MMFAISRVKKMRTKLEKASNYHSNDYYLYSKKRTSASIKIQAVYRMCGLRRKFHAHKLQVEKEKAVQKTQKKFEKHLQRYVTRLNEVSGKSVESHCADRVGAYDNGVEIDLEQHRATCPKNSSEANVGMVPYRCASPSFNVAAQILECSCWFQHQ